MLKSMINPDLSGKKIFMILCVLFSSLIICSTLAYSIPINVETAKQVAKNWYSEKINDSSNKFKIVETFTEKENSENIYYILNFNPTSPGRSPDKSGTGGFIIVSADDIVVPILGYSFKQNYGLENHPPQFDAMLTNFKEQIVYAKENRLSATREIKDEWERLEVKTENFEKIRSIKGVSPLITVNWNQGWDWNEYCPADAAGPGGHVYAGCTAVATAQVMKYWNHPTTGTGSHSYSCPPYGILSADFGGTTYNWANMPDNSATDDTKTLLYHCGVSIETEYGPTGSGAFVSYVVPALNSYFGYDTTAQFLWKLHYTDTIWEDMIRNELDNGRPLIYSGGTHCFNLDGYEGINHFHFNWGWSGTYNGYYYLLALNPGSHNYTDDQCGIFNLFPISNAPDWQVIPGTLYSMVLMAQITLDGEIFEGVNNNMAAAFCWTDSLECRCTATWESGADFWYFDIVSNIASGEDITFKIYDATTDMIYNCNDTIIFEDNATIGSPINPYPLTSTTKPVVIIAIDGDNVILTWCPVPGATDYKVYISDDPYNGFSELSTTGGANTYTHIDGAISPKYFYRVNALNGGSATINK